MTFKSAPAWPTKERLSQAYEAARRALEAILDLVVALEPLRHRVHVLLGDEARLPLDELVSRARDWRPGPRVVRRIPEALMLLRDAILEGRRCITPCRPALAAASNGPISLGNTTESSWCALALEVAEQVFERVVPTASPGQWAEILRDPKNLPLDPDCADSNWLRACERIEMLDSLDLDGLGAQVEAEREIVLGRISLPTRRFVPFTPQDTDPAAGRRPSPSEEKVLKLLKDRTPEFCTAGEIEDAFGGRTNARTIVNRLREKRFAIESATAARCAGKPMSSDAKGYRLEV